MKSQKLPNFKHALARVHLDVWHWTPKGETNGLSTLYIQKALNLTLGIPFRFFVGGL